MSSTTKSTNHPRIVESNLQLRRAIATFHVNPNDDNNLSKHSSGGNRVPENWKIIRRKSQTRRHVWRSVRIVKKITGGWQIRG